MKFSICIPNYNYGGFIERTIRSVLSQNADIEVIVADNASTDDSVSVVEAIDDPRLTLHRNRWNLGFAGNLDRSAQHATGDRMILLSSDDIVLPGSLEIYDRIAGALGDEHLEVIFNATQIVIDAEDRQTDIHEKHPRFWAGATRDAQLSDIAGGDVWRIDAAVLLARSLDYMRVPIWFAATCYSRSLYEAVEGYGGKRLINPDKAFAWKLLTRAKTVIHVDRPLFGYRVHTSNQSAQQKESGALKHIIDQYTFTFDIDPETLARAGRTHDDLAKAFIEQDIALRGLQMLARGRRTEARRMLSLGYAAYPNLMRRSTKVQLLRGLLTLGPLGTTLVSGLYDRALKRHLGQG